MRSWTAGSSRKCARSRSTTGLRCQGAFPNNISSPLPSLHWRSPIPNAVLLPAAHCLERCNSCRRDSRMLTFNTAHAHSRVPAIASCHNSLHQQRHVIGSFSLPHSRIQEGLAPNGPCRPIWCQTAHRGNQTSLKATPQLGALTYIEGYTEVEEVQGMRIGMDGETPRVEYLVKWKDGSDSTWEPAINLSEDLVRDYEEKWWQAARKVDLETMAKMLGGGPQALSMVVDENGRSALHFAAALGNVDCVKLLVEAGASTDLQDKDGYTPIHMAAGYMHTSTMAALLEAGADPEIKDNTGKDVVLLVDNLRKSMPLSPATIQRRIALEQVSSVLTDRVYEEVQPAQILNVRTREEDGIRELLVQFPDGRDDEWIDERDMAPDILEDFDAGLEYATASQVVDVVQVGTERRFKVVWTDDYPTSWEREEHLDPQLIALFQQQNPQLFEQRVAAAASGEAGSWPLAAEAEWAQAEAAAEMQTADGYRTQYAPVRVASS